MSEKMIFRMIGDFFNQMLEDERGEKVSIGWPGHSDFDEFPFKDQFVEGGRIILCDTELQFEAVLEFEQESKRWYARIIPSSRRDLESPADGLEVYKHASAEERLAILKYESKVLMGLIQYDITELEKMTKKPGEDLAENIVTWGEEFVRIINIIKDMVEALT